MAKSKNNKSHKKRSKQRSKNNKSRSSLGGKDGIKTLMVGAMASSIDEQTQRITRKGFVANRDGSIMSKKEKDSNNNY